MSDKTKVQFAYAHQTEDGRHHKPDASAFVPTAEANLLIWSGTARLAVDEPADTSAEEQHAKPKK